jgi:hypothetical protein
MRHHSIPCLSVTTLNLPLYGVDSLIRSQETRTVAALLAVVPMQVMLVNQPLASQHCEPCHHAQKNSRIRGRTMSLCSIVL